MAATPSAKHLVWPVARHQVNVIWDADAPFGGGPIGWAPAYSMHLVYEPLTTVGIGTDADGVRYPIASDTRPRLAIRWEPSPDRREWRIHLRQGVRSHAGNELTAEDVKWSWDRSFALRGLGLWRSRRVAGVLSANDVQALDRFSIRFRTVGPNPELPQFLVFPTNMVIDSVEARKHTSEADPWAAGWLAKNVAGYGAFDLAGQGDDAVDYRARDEFWSGKPGIDAVTHVGVESREQALDLLLHGDANIALNLYPEELAHFAGRPEFTLMRARATHSGLDLNFREPPFDDQRVRQAVAYALPYDRIFRDVYQGNARPCRSPLSPTAKYYSEESWRFRTDSARARKLLAQAGHPNGLATDLWVGASRESLRFGEVARDALKDAGIHVEVHVGRHTGEGEPPMRFREECGHALTEAMYDLAHDYYPPLGLQSTVSEQDRIWADQLKAIRVADAVDQPRLYQDIQRELNGFCAIIPLAELQMGWVFRGEIDPWALSPACLGVMTNVWGAHRWDLGA